MDFVTCLPLSRGFTTIMVVVDWLSKYAHFASLPARFDALRVVRLFIDTLVKNHGFPKILVSDRDPIFLIDVWKAMLTLSGTKLHFLTAIIRNLMARRRSEIGVWSNTCGLLQQIDCHNGLILSWAELVLNFFHHSAWARRRFTPSMGTTLLPR